jgi:hypothetical protein
MTLTLDRRPPAISPAGAGRLTVPAHVIAALLVDAHAALAERGLCREDFCDDDTGTVDLTGALRLAADLHPRDEPADPYLTRVLAAAEDTLALHLDGTGFDPAVDDPGEALTGWTDQPDRTVTDVLALIDRAIRTLATTAS